MGKKWEELEGRSVSVCSLLRNGVKWGLLIFTVLGKMSWELFATIPRVVKSFCAVAHLLLPLSGLSKHRNQAIADLLKCLRAALEVQQLEKHVLKAGEYPHPLKMELGEGGGNSTLVYGEDSKNGMGGTPPRPPRLSRGGIGECLLAASTIQAT